MVASLVVFLNTQLPFTVVPSGRTTLVNCSAVLIISPLNSQFSKMIVPKSPLIVTSSSTDWEDRVCCFQTLLHPLRSGVPSFPELLCPLSPSARFPVWVSVWVRHYWSYSLVDANVCCSYHLFYPEDGRLEISNNCTEHSIKPIVMARKNWLLANTPSGA